MKEPDREQALFDVLEPPTGGRRAFQRRIVLERRKRVRRRRVVAAGATSAVFVLALVVAFGQPLPPSQAPARALDFELARMRIGVVDVPGSAVTIPAVARGNTAALRVPTRDDGVVLYLVASNVPVEDVAEGDGELAPDARDDGV